MWYYKLTKTFLNFPKIFIYLLLYFIQKKSKSTYKKFSVLNIKESDRSFNFLFLKNLDECKSFSKSNCNCLILMPKFKFFDFFKNIRFIKRIRIVDINYFGHLGLNMFINIGYFDLLTDLQRVKLKKQSLDNYFDLKEFIKDEEVFVLGTNTKFSYILKKLNKKPVFLCNDAVKEISKIDSKIKVLSFADPMFHFSIHKKAIDFLQLVKKNEKSIDFLIVPINTIPILNFFKLDVKIIGVTSSNKINSYLKIDKLNITTKKTHNVITQFLLPIAASTSKHVSLGAVTTKNSNNNSLWKYDDLLVKNNPKAFAFNYSFFKDRNFRKYYKNHYFHLKNIIEQNENISLI